MKHQNLMCLLAINIDNLLRFDGKLAPEVVEDILGEAAKTPSKELSLINKGFRDVALLTGPIFASLQILNLSDNSLTSFVLLSVIPNLRALCLNNNKVQRLMDETFVPFRG